VFSKPSTQNVIETYFISKTKVYFGLNHSNELDHWTADFDDDLVLPSLLSLKPNFIILIFGSKLCINCIFQ
jgi:hypothetical protein